ncbi:alpha/beta fold hydrolase [Stackebrandtia albiflava]|uniref:alpha/beta fold hydrolase n=1 Tax=Stackebrandtia albiflava TaxID=406432 RepID=UPI001B85F9E6|nr:alpha/beta hydrolase [Stackebrandtia albiflava]
MAGDLSRRRVRRVGIIGAIAGLAAAGVAAGVATERYLVNKARRDPDDPYADEPFGRLPADSVRMVTTPDDVTLRVETVATEATAGDPSAAKATVVFVHGYCLDQGTFHFQRRALTESHLPVRGVFYDQPGHGGSGALPVNEYDMDSLSEALASVIRAVAPRGPLVLVGHSMGAMTIMAYSRRHPEEFAARVAGVALLSTSAGKLDQVSFGAPRALARARRLLLPVFSRAVAMTPGAIDRVRRIAGDLAWLLTRRYGFAIPDPSPALVSYVEKMNTETPIKTVVGFTKTLLEHDEHESLAAFRDVPVLISSGEEDQFTPAAHSVALAEAMPHAKLLMIPQAGHVALLERPHQVSGPLLEFLDACVAPGAAGRPERVLEETPAEEPAGWRRKKKSRDENGTEE